MTSTDGGTRTVLSSTIDDLHGTYQGGAVANDGISILINPGEVYGLEPANALLRVWSPRNHPQGQRISREPERPTNAIDRVAGDEPQ